MKKKPHEMNHSEALAALLESILCSDKTTKIPSSFRWFNKIRPLAQAVRSTMMGAKISVRETARRNGYIDHEYALDDWAEKKIVPATCSSGCEVESDGYCPHGHPSVLVAVDAV
jgi:hypothetical protein